MEIHERAISSGVLVTVTSNDPFVRNSMSPAQVENELREVSLRQTIADTVATARQGH